MKNIKINTWNVNGIRACQKKGFLPWFKKQNAEIVCLMETKAHKEQLDKKLLSPSNYYSYFAEAVKKGYSGVALYSKKTLSRPKITIGLNKKIYDNEARTIIAEYPKFIILCCYFPNGGREHKRVPYKLSYSKEILKSALKLKKKTKKEIIITGDVNTAHNEIDLKNPKENSNTSGFLPIERKYIDELLSKGFYDIFRILHPKKIDKYTWWSYRNNCRERNIGWRIDYFFITKNLIKKIKKVYHQEKIKGSDHCPITLEFTI